MRVLRKLIVLGLAGLGLYKAWEMVGPTIGAAHDKTAMARDRVEPALRDAKNTVQSASRDAAGTLLDASKDAADSLADAVGDTMPRPSTDQPAPDASETTAAPSALNR